MIRVCIFFLFYCCYVSANAQQITKGVYGNPGSLIKAGYRFDSLGLNAIFVRSISLDRDLFIAAKSQGCKLFVEFPLLNGKEYLKEHPEAWPITEKGERADAADWFMGICPTNAEFKKFRSNQLHDLLSQYVVDGVFLDYVHWHAQFETDKPILPETCFCDNCVQLFSAHIAKQIPGETIAMRAAWILQNADASWRFWRIGVLNEWVSDMKKIVKDIDSRTLLGIYHCAWYPDDHNGALGRILGIDMTGLAKRADVLSPMLFHGMLGRPTEWVGQYLNWFGKNFNHPPIGPQVWPIVQAHNKPGIISAGEFKKVMLLGMRSPSSGIMMFSDGSLLDDPEKIRVVKEIFGNKR